LAAGLAVEAVIGEPVSKSYFPVSRGKYREMSAFEAGHDGAGLVFRLQIKMFLPHSLKSKQGISLTEQGIIRSLTRKEA
jgi:hypothetical protein